MRIALVQMPPNPRDTPPYDVALSCAVLRKAGHEVTVRDLSNEIYHRVFKQRPYWKFRMASHLEDHGRAIYSQKRELFLEEAKRLLEGRPDVIVFRTENALDNAWRIAQVLRDLSPRTPLVSSGSVTPQKHVISGWKEGPCFGVDGRWSLPFDFHIIGEDDIALPAVLEALAGGRTRELSSRFQVAGKVVDCREEPVVKDLDSLPFYDFTDFDFMSYADPRMMRLNVSRGCIQHCAFCIDWIVVRKPRTMSGDRWFEEYRCQLSRHPSIRHMRHYDRLMNADIASLERFCDLMAARFPAPPVIWGGDCIIRPEMTSELLGKMARAGCNNIGVGFESGSERVRQAMDKGFFTNALTSEFLANCRRNGIAATLNILVGYPTETPEDLEESIRFIRANKENVFEIRLTFPTVQLSPGSPLYYTPQRYGIGSPHEDKWVSQDGSNDYRERVRRFRVFCEAMLEGGVRLAVNRRLVKTGAALKNLLDELEPGLEACAPPAPAEARRLEARSRLERALRMEFGLEETLSVCEGLLASLEDSPEDLAVIHTLMGQVLRRLERHEESLGHFRAVVERYPQNRAALFEARMLLLQAAWEGGEREEALRGYEGLLGQYEGCPGWLSQIRFCMGWVCLELGRLEEAQGHFQVVVDRFPDRLNHWYLMSRTHLSTLARRRGRLEEALAGYLELLPDCEPLPLAGALVNLCLGEAYAEAGRAGESEERLRRVVDRYPDCVRFVRAARRLLEAERTYA